MEKLWIGLDGGGTKTAVAAVDAEGKLRACIQTGGTSYRQYGFAAVLERVRQGVADCLTAADAQPEQVAGYCFGVPCYGESIDGDVQLQALLAAAFAPVGIYVCNDAEVGWAGSLACKSGINIVAGTGSIAFGCNGAGKTARSGGWCEFFGDEGSCYWVGRRTMELFSKQADGRLPRGALYGIVCEALALQNDFAFIEAIERNFAPYREKTASFQRYTEQAALAGDRGCIVLYEQAAEELARCIKAIQRQLAFEGCTTVSYSGGLFRAGELVLRPFLERLEALNCSAQQPYYSPVHGAALLAHSIFKS